MDDDDQVTGAVVSIRRVQDKLAVWTRHADHVNEPVIQRIGYGFYKFFLYCFLVVF